MTNHLTILATITLLNLVAALACARIDDVLPPTDLGQTWVQIGEQIYGAQPNQLGPIGGAAGYQRIVTDGDYRVSTLDQLRATLKTVKPGQTIYIEQTADLDCTALVFAERLVLDIPAGITLASNRGHQGSAGAIICSDAFATNPLIRIVGPDVRITGLRLRGPDPKRRVDHGDRAFNPNRGDPNEQGQYYRRLPIANGIVTRHAALEIDNCELSGWSGIAVALSQGDRHHIHHNYIHHNQRHHLGYGIGHDENAVSLIEYNLFDYNRHSIAASGAAGIGYEARHNIEIQHALSHNFDMHGGTDRRDGTNIAGEWMKVHHNTFRAPDVPAVMIRGVPRQQADVHNNWFYHEKLQGAVVHSSSETADTNVNCYNNAYGPHKPAILDARYNTSQAAFDAALAAYRNDNYTEARAKFVKALALAREPSDISAAHLHIGHCYRREQFITAARDEYQTVLNSPIAPQDQKSMAQELLQQLHEPPSETVTSQWSLAFSDDFQRGRLGGSWRIIQGDWKIESGKLLCAKYPAEITVKKDFPGCHRLEFDVITEAKNPSDLSPVIQSGSTGFASGYLLQFGGYGNTINRILRLGNVLEGKSVDHRFIEPRKLHKVVAQFDGQAVQLSVDGNIMARAADKPGLSGPQHQTVGLYLFCNATLDNVRVYTANLD